MAGAITPATVLRRYQDQPGAKAPGQRPPRPWRALLARRVGRWPSAGPGPASLQGTVARGRGKRGSRFRVPPGEVKALSPLQWQGPSPLPQCYADISTSRGPKPPASARPALGGRFAPAGSGAGLSLVPDLPVYRAPSRAGGGNAGRVSWSRPEWRRQFHRCNGRGHRPCHSATLTLDQPGAQSPRPAPAPPSAGASPPPGRALASVLPGPAGLQGAVARGRGNAVRFLVPPARTKHCHRCHGKGHRLCQSATLITCPPRPRRALASVLHGPAGQARSGPRLRPPRICRW